MSATVDWGRLGQHCLDAISASKANKDDWAAIQEAGQALFDAAQHLKEVGRIAELHDKINHSREQLKRMETEMAILTGTEIPE